MFVTESTSRLVEPAGSTMQSGVLTLTETVLPVLADAFNNPVFFAATGSLRERSPEMLERWTATRSSNRKT